MCMLCQLRRDVDVLGASIVLLNTIQYDSVDEVFEVLSTAVTVIKKYGNDINEGEVKLSLGVTPIDHTLDEVKTFDAIRLSFKRIQGILEALENDLASFKDLEGVINMFATAEEAEQASPEFASFIEHLNMDDFEGGDDNEDDDRV